MGKLLTNEQVAATARTAASSPFGPIPPRKPQPITNVMSLWRQRPARSRNPDTRSRPIFPSVDVGHRPQPQHPGCGGGSDRSEHPVLGVVVLHEESRDRRFVSWHQDSTYYGLSSPKRSPSGTPSRSPTRRRLHEIHPGSHRDGILEHDETWAKNNLLMRGQTVRDIDEAAAVDVQLEPGEFSIHHESVVHGSVPTTPVTSASVFPSITSRPEFARPGSAMPPRPWCVCRHARSLAAGSEDPDRPGFRSGVPRGSRFHLRRVSIRRGQAELIVPCRRFWPANSSNGAAATAPYGRSTCCPQARPPIWRSVRWRRPSTAKRKPVSASRRICRFRGCGIWSPILASSTLPRIFSASISPAGDRHSLRKRCPIHGLFRGPITATNRLHTRRQHGRLHANQSRLPLRFFDSAP